MDVRGIRRGLHPDLRVVFDKAVDAGWGWKKTGHMLVLIPPGGKPTVGMTTTNSKARATKNVIAAARRSGLDI